VGYWQKHYATNLEFREIDQALANGTGNGRESE
jgi:hypothetical protein